MSERQQNRNPWAEKLFQVTLPDGGESWKAMEALLDREMPAGPGKDRRRWFILIVLLLLLIGVCNCPGRRWFFAGKTETFRAVPAGGKAQSGPSAGGPATRAGNGKTEVGDSVVGARPVGSVTRGLAKEGSATEGSATQGSVTETRPGNLARVKKDRVSGAGRNYPGTRERAGVTPDTTTEVTRDTIAGSRPVGNAKKNPLKNPVKSVAKTPPGTPKDSAKRDKDDGWMVGIGLNQFFSVGGQQASSWNSGGITGTLGDYIPVPMVRYYFHPKLYVQLEVQINTPQYTKKNLVAVSTPVDSIGTTTGGALITVQKSVSINKLFYFNIPLSLHYTVFGHLDIGTGLQYSRLTNGIGVFNNNFDTGGTASLSTETKSFKGDSVYQKIKTHEFRFLVDVNYNWKHFIVGIRYNQALSKFIHVEISPGQITQARNSSLQLYLRYILWDGRKKKPLLPAK
jgi:hypothetical protein